MIWYNYDLQMICLSETGLCVIEFLVHRWTFRLWSWRATGLLNTGCDHTCMSITPPYSMLSRDHWENKNADFAFLIQFVRVKTEIHHCIALPLSTFKLLFSIFVFRGFLESFASNAGHTLYDGPLFSLMSFPSQNTAGATGTSRHWISLALALFFDHLTAVVTDV